MSHVFYRTPSRSYPIIDRGEDIYLWDTTGQRYLDGSSGALVVNVGHGRARVAEAMAAQARRVAFAHTMRFTSDAQEHLGSRIAQHLPHWAGAYTYLVSGGSEAVETAIKLARHYHRERGDLGRFKIMTRWASYHGNTLGALAASGHLLRRRPYAPLLADPAFIHFAPEGHKPTEPCTCAADLEAMIQQQDPTSIAALMLEVVGGSALSGFVPHPGYLATVEQVCRRYGMLFIVDEVMTGMGRTGDWWAHEQEGIHPDMMVLAKGLASGYSPLGAVVARRDIWEAVRGGSGSFPHGFTYGGNPVSAAAGGAVFAIMEDEGLVENAQRQASYLRHQLECLQAHHPLVTAIRGRGLMQGLVLATHSGPGGKRAQEIADEAFRQGLIIYPGSGNPQTPQGDHLLVAPPLTVQAGGIDELIGLLDATFTKIEATTDDIP